MNIAPIIFFDMAAGMLILAVALVVAVYYLSKITKALHAGLSLKDEAFQKNANALDEAGAKAVRIIDDANNKALDIVNRVTLSADVTSANFSREISRVSSAQIKEFEKAIADFTKIYSQILQDLKIKNIEVFQNVSKDIEMNTTEEIKNFKESMQALTTLSQKEVRKKIDTDYETAKKAIENYKEEEMQKIDSEIYEFLEKMSKLVLGKALSLSEHEDLITQSLEKAKKEGVFK